MSGGDGTGPRMAQGAPAAYAEPGGPETFRRAGGPEAVPPGRVDPRPFAVPLGLLGLAAAAALAAPGPAEACAPAARTLAGPAPATSATPRPTAPATGCATPEPTPGRSGGPELGGPLPRIPAAPGQPLVAITHAKLTGSAVTMTGLRLEGIVELPTAEGTRRTLKFTMDRVVTDDFLLRSPGPAGRSTRIATKRLILEGDVALYATRFTGRLLGIEITVTPDLPYGIPITSSRPVTVTDPVVDLAFVTSDALTASPKLQLTLD